MVPEIGDVVIFVPVKNEILPVPLAAKFIAVFEFVHEYNVPITFPEKFIAAVKELLQTTWSTGFKTVGFGLTVMLNDWGVPEQVSPAFKLLGVTVTVPEIAAFVAFVVVNDGIFPVDAAPSPIAEFVLVQEYNVPGTPKELVKVTGLEIVPTQFAWLLSASTVGIGLTIMDTSWVEPTHVIPALI